MVLISFDSIMAEILLLCLCSEPSYAAFLPQATTNFVISSVLLFVIALRYMQGCLCLSCFRLASLCDACDCNSFVYFPGISSKAQTAHRRIYAFVPEQHQVQRQSTGYWDRNRLYRDCDWSLEDSQQQVNAFLVSHV